MFKPLLSATQPLDDFSNVPFPVYASPKLDGIRCTFQNGVAYSRNGRPIPNEGLPQLARQINFNGFDTELIVGKPTGENVYNRSQALMGAASVDFTAWVIDYMSEDSLKNRFVFLRNIFRGSLNDRIKLIPQKLIHNEAALLAYEEATLKKGYEGVMLRRADQGGYPQKPGKSNRSTLREYYLVRLKRREHGFGKILAAYPLKHNHNTELTSTGKKSTRKAGLLVDVAQIGSVTLKDINNSIEFEVSVDSQQMRKHPGWLHKSSPFIGRVVRYTYDAKGTVTGGKPRQPKCSFEELLG